MNQQQSTTWKKPLGWAYGIVLVFTTTYLVGGILLEKLQHKKGTP